MKATQFPRTMSHGYFKGRTFQTGAEYQIALKTLHDKHPRSRSRKPAVMNHKAELDLTITKDGATVVTVSGQLPEVLDTVLTVLGSFGG